jgi:ABC-type branched-subunit amino acid transport system permease subunit
MDYSHSPFLIYLIGGLGVLLGVVFLALALVLLRRPRDGGPGGPAGPAGG